MITQIVIYILMIIAVMLLSPDADDWVADVVVLLFMIYSFTIVFLITNLEKWSCEWYPAIVKYFKNISLPKNVFKIKNSGMSVIPTDSGPKFKKGDIVRVTKNLGWTNAHLNNMELTVNKITSTKPYGYFLTGVYQEEILTFIVGENELEYV
jgi:hypothetical protein